MRIHILITVLTAVFIMAILYLSFDPFYPTACRYHDYEAMDSAKIVGKSIHVLLIILLMAQSIFFVNLGAGMILLFEKSSEIR